ncbi:hypothetical protein L916_17984 [Phytophthora nicotianae]|uniref:Uncharacterized protein n=1 Tax=Phytophthora nicotianae TaxID=4792 RepID=W2I3B5_PHYNI|nr:hypothetical protein L916_17984 [Phytophthora nicotianae]
MATLYGVRKEFSALPYRKLRLRTHLRGYRKDRTNHSFASL